MEGIEEDVVAVVTACTDMEVALGEDVVNGIDEDKDGRTEVSAEEDTRVTEDNLDNVAVLVVETVVLVVVAVIVAIVVEDVPYIFSDEATVPGMVASTALEIGMCGMDGVLLASKFGSDLVATFAFCT